MLLSCRAVLAVLPCVLVDHTVIGLVGTISCGVAMFFCRPHIIGPVGTTKSVLGWFAGNCVSSGLNRSALCILHKRGGSRVIVLVRGCVAAQMGRCVVVLGFFVMFRVIDSGLVSHVAHDVFLCLIFNWSLCCKCAVAVLHT